MKHCLFEMQGFQENYYCMILLVCLLEVYKLLIFPDQSYENTHKKMGQNCGIATEDKIFQERRRKQWTADLL